MKKIIYSFALAVICSHAYGQVAIGKISVEGASTILDFNNITTNTKGIILPSVENLSMALSSTPFENNGTFLFDKSDSKIKMYENNAWIELSGTGSNSQIITNTSQEAPNNLGVVIGSDASNAKGILVLESTTKAMVLPKIADPHTNVKSPYPGMMCYDTTTHSLALFDGLKWNYWK
ncbi:hypothetical protein D3C87_524600 [compost metagenome]